MDCEGKKIIIKEERMQLLEHCFMGMILASMI